MIGHSKCAAGLAGLIKAAFALHHKVLPPTLVEAPNPKANLDGGPLYLNTEARPWVHGGGASAHRGRQRVRLRRHQLPHRPRRVHRRLPEPARVRTSTLAGGAVRLAAAGHQGHSDRGVRRSAATRLPPVLRPNSADLAASRLAIEPARRRPADPCRRRDLARRPEGEARRGAGWRSAKASDDTLPTRAASTSPRSQMPRSARWPSCSRARGRSTRTCSPSWRWPSPKSGAYSTAPSVHWRSELDRPLGKFIYPPSPFTPEQEAANRKELQRTEVAQPAVGAASLGMFRLLTGARHRSRLLGRPQLRRVRGARGRRGAHRRRPDSPVASPRAVQSRTRRQAPPAG